MADLSTADLESGVNELSYALSEGDWNDSVKNSYYCFVDEEKRLISDIKWQVDEANKIYANICSVNVGKFKSEYSECLSKLVRLQRGN